MQPTEAEDEDTVKQAALTQVAVVREHSHAIGKRWDMTYRSGRVKSWLKIKNPKAPAARRVDEGSF